VIIVYAPGCFALLMGIYSKIALSFSWVRYYVSVYCSWLL